MAVTWGRGFFRAWIVVAALWLICSVALGYGMIASPYIPLKIVATPTGGTTTSYDFFSPQHSEFQRGVAEGALLETPIRDGHLLYTRADIAPARLTERLTEARAIIDAYTRSETGDRRSQAIQTVLSWTLLPPLVLLALGWAIGWVISGFRKRA